MQDYLTCSAACVQYKAGVNQSIQGYSPHLVAPGLNEAARMSVGLILRPFYFVLLFIAVAAGHMRPCANMTYTS